VSNFLTDMIDKPRAITETAAASHKSNSSPAMIEHLPAATRGGKIDLVIQVVSTTQSESTQTRALMLSRAFVGLRRVLSKGPCAPRLPRFHRDRIACTGPRR